MSAYGYSRTYRTLEAGVRAAVWATFRTRLAWADLKARCTR